MQVKKGFGSAMDLLTPLHADADQSAETSNTAFFTLSNHKSNGIVFKCLWILRSRTLTPQCPKIILYFTVLIFSFIFWL